MIHQSRKCYSLQGGDVVVINEHPLNLVVEELGVVALLTWKQKIILTWFYIKRNVIHVMRGGHHLLHRL